MSRARNHRDGCRWCRNRNSGAVCIGWRKEASIFNRKDEFYANGEKTVKKIQQMVPDCEVSIHPLEETDALYAAIKDSDILVNATKVGMKPLDDQSLVEDVSVFHPDLW